MPRKQPLQARSRATCDALVEAAAQILVREGAGRLTTGRVAERAGASVGTLYQYFDGRDDLLAAVQARHVARLVRAAEDAVAQADPARPHQAVAAFLDRKRAHLPVSLALAALPATLPPAPVGDRFAAALLPLVVSGDRDGPPLARARVMAAALEGAIGQALRTDPACFGAPWFRDLLEGIVTGRAAAGPVNVG